MTTILCNNFALCEYVVFFVTTFYRGKEWSRSTQRMHKEHYVLKINLSL
jgi:hypothetical protein